MNPLFIPIVAAGAVGIYGFKKLAEKANELDEMDKPPKYIERRIRNIVYIGSPTEEEEEKTEEKVEEEIEKEDEVQDEIDEESSEEDPDDFLPASEFDIEGASIDDADQSADGADEGGMS